MSESAVQPSPQPPRERRRTFTSALRMAVYPMLAVVLISFLVLNPRVQEEYYYQRWANAKDERDRYFTKLRGTKPIRKRMAVYWGKRALELTENEIGRIYLDDKGEFRFGNPNPWTWDKLQPAIDGKYGDAIISAFEKALLNNDLNVRRNAAESLCNMGIAAKAAIPSLVKALDDKNYVVQCFAAKALGKMGTEAKQAIPALKNALNDENEFVRLAVSDAIQKIHSATLPAQK